MKNIRRPLLVSLLAACAAGAPLLAEPAAKPVSTHPAAPAPLTDGSYELRGFFGTGDKLMVSLKKHGETASKWVPVGKKTGALLVESADPKAGFAIVNISGARYRMNLSAERQGQAQPEPPVLTASAPVSPTTEEKQRRERFQALVKGLTPEQRQSITASVKKKMAESVRNAGESGVDFARNAKTSRAALLDGLREALKMPGKDGQPGVVPADFDKVVEAGLGGRLGDSGLIEKASETIPDPSNPGQRMITMSLASDETAKTLNEISGEPLSEAAQQKQAGISAMTGISFGVPESTPAPKK